MANERYPLSNFPDSIDNILEAVDIAATDQENVEDYQQALLDGDTEAMQTALDAIGEAKRINAGRYNQIRDAILAIEDYCQTGANNIFNKLNYQGVWSYTRAYNVNNIVSYTASGATKLYIALQDIMPSTAQISNANYWRVFTINISGINCNYRQSYVNTTSYVINDIVTYNNSLYLNILACTGILPTVVTNWVLLVESQKPIQYPYTTTTPSNPENGDLWFYPLSYES